MEWQSCERCKHELKDGKKGSPCFDCGIEAKGYEPKTNADRIRYMTDEELAKLLCKSLSEIDEKLDCKYCDEPLNEYGSCTCKCEKLCLQWLQAEVKEGELGASKNEEI